MMEKIIAYLFLLLFSAIFVARIFCKKKSTIRIGTTGDYEPLTWYDPEKKEYRGLDIDIVKYFAKSNGLHVQFILTTWKTLTQDLLDQKFDIAVGGISTSEERKSQFSFSKSILEDKKVAVIRCSDREKLSSFELLNRKEVRLIENIGGTNEVCARKYFKKSSLTLFPSNRNIFSHILNNDADAMVTDQVEANNQVKKNSSLCIVEIPDEYSCHTTLAYMLRKEDKRLLEKINAAIDEIKKNGEFSNLSKRWL